MSDLQPADKCERRDLLTTVENSGQLALEENNVRLLEAISRSHRDRVKVVVTSLGCLARGVLREEGLCDFQEVVESAVAKSRNILKPRPLSWKER